MRINREGKFMAYRNEKRPLAFGHGRELSIDVRPAKDHEDYGYAYVESERFGREFKHLNEDDVAVFQQFVAIAKRKGQ